MRRALGIGLLWLGVALAGCTGDAAEKSLPSDATESGGPSQSKEFIPLENFTLEDVNAPFTIPFNAGGCHGSHVYLDLDANFAKGSIPSGWQPRDAHEFMGLPTSSGRTVVSLEVVHCDSSGFAGGALDAAALSVYVESPGVGPPLDAVGTEWYQVAAWTPTAPLLDVFADINGTSFNGSVTHAVLAVPNGPTTGDGKANDEAGQVFEVDTVGAVAHRQIELSRRVWHQTLKGLLHTDYEVKTDTIDGSASCKVRQDSLVYEATLLTDCLPNHLWYAQVWNDTTWEGEIQYWPDVRVPSS